MNTQTIPQTIAAIIEKETARLLAEKELKRVQAEDYRVECLERGQKRYEAFMEAQLAKLPEFMRPFASAANQRESDLRFNEEYSLEDFLVAHGDENDTLKCDLIFDVPGLAPILFFTEKEIWGSSTAAWEDRSDKTLAYRCYWNALRVYDTLDKVLVAARQEFETMQGLLKEKEKDDDRRIQDRTRDAELEQRVDEEAEQKKAAEKSEEEALFEAVRRYPLVVLVLKALVTVQRERTYFESRLEEASDSMESLAGFWNRKADELRKQADDAQRRADEERSRASDLAYDLDKAEEEIQKAKRGW